MVVEDITFIGLMRIKLKLMNNFPHVQTVDLSFMEPPKVDFDLNPLGFDLNIIPGLNSFIHSQVDANLGPMMYDPNAFTLNLEQLLSGVPLDTAVGVLQITLVRGTNLKGVKLGGGTPDPYVSVSIAQRAELARTKTKRSTANPRWNETKFLLINSLNDVLSLAVYDFNDRRKDNELGVANFTLQSLEQQPEHLGVATPVMLQGKERGFLNYDIRFYPVQTPKKLPDGSMEVLPETNTGVARITLHQAKSVDPKGGNSVNPSGRLLLDGQVVATSPTLRRTGNPVWELAKEVLVSDRANATVSVRVVDDRGIGSDPTIGHLTVKLRDILDANAKSQDWFPLNGSPSGGRVRITATWKGVLMAGAINGARSYTKPIGVIRIFARRGIDLKNVEFGGKSDPYLRVLNAGVVLARTLVVNNDLDPVWDEIIYVAVHSATDKFVLEAMDYQHQSKDRTLGTAELSAATLLREGTDAVKAPWLGTGKKSLRESLRSDNKKTVKGAIEFEAEFFPCANLKGVSFDTGHDPLAETATIEDASPDLEPTPPTSNGVVSAPSSAVKPGHQRTSSVATTATAAIAELEDEPPTETGGIEMSKTQLLSAQSGILVVNVVKGTLARKGARLEIMCNSEYWPAYATEAARSTTAEWDEVGEMFVRELDMTHVVLKLNAAEKDTQDQVYADTKMDLKEFLDRCLDKPASFKLADPMGGHQSEVTLQAKYIPVDIAIEPRESVNNMGSLLVTVVEGRDLLGMDRGGKYSDPYAAFELNGERVFKTQVIKKTLNAKWNEKFDCTVPSRVAANFVVKVYDWDLGGAHDKLGNGRIDLAQLTPFEAMQVVIPLALEGKPKKGEVVLSLVFRPEFIVRNRAATSTFSGAGRVATGLGAGVVGVGKGIGGVGVGVVGGAAKGVGKVGGAGVGAVGKVGGAAFHALPGHHRKNTSSIDSSINGGGYAVDPVAAAATNGGGAGPPAEGSLRITILDATVSDADAKPYVVIAQGSKTLDKSHRVKKGSEHESFIIRTTSEPMQLSLSVLDKKTFGKDRPLGSAALDVFAFVGPSAPHASPVLDLDSADGSGRLQLELDWTPAGAALPVPDGSPASVKTFSRSRFSLASRDMREESPAPA